jgi:ferric-dicitrate binding protein FerR (iron transport regulator)
MKTRALLTGIFFLTASVISACSFKAGVPIPAKISFLTGTVLVNGIEARLGQVIGQGDIIETRAQSYCRIIVDDKNIIGMQDDSVLEYKISREDALLNLKKGFLGIIVKSRENIGNFRVNTATMTAGVRGTSFFIGNETPDRVYTCICNGVIHYHPAGHAKSERFAAAHHKAIYYTRRGSTVSGEPGGMKYHTDSDVEKLASEINVRIDWTKIDE